MTALQVVHLILEAGEDPKKVFRQLPRSRVPGPDEVTYGISADWEQDRPEGQFDNPEDVVWIRQQIRDGNVWGWCSVEVTATWEDEDGVEHVGHDYLGGCSYESEESFKEPGGYYDDMKSEAYDDLVKELERNGIT